MTKLQEPILEALTSVLVGGCVGVDYNQVGTQLFPNIAVESLGTRPARIAAAACHWQSLRQIVVVEFAVVLLFHFLDLFPNTLGIR